MDSARAAKAAPPYGRPSEPLDDYTERLGLLLERLKLVRSVLPDQAVVSAEERRARLAQVSEEHAELQARLAVVDRRIAARTAETRRAGQALPLELLRERLGLSPLDVGIACAAAVLERGSAFNQYLNASARETPQPDVAFYMALLSDDEATLPEQVRLRFSP